MKRISFRNGIIALLAGTAALAALSAVSARTLPFDRPADIVAASQDSAPEERFAQAPFGVDAMVTGPVSKEFRQRRDALDCDRAEWPHIPAACYPD